MIIKFKANNLNIKENENTLMAGLLALPGVYCVDIDYDNEQICLHSDKQSSLEDIVRFLYGSGSHLKNINS